MIKKLFIAAILAIPFALSAQTKIGVVDMQTLVAASPKTQEVNNELQQTQKQYAADIQKLQEEMQRKFDEYQKEKANPDALPAVIERHEKALQEMDERLQRQQQTYMQDLQQQQQQKMAPIVDEIQKKVQEVGAEQKLTAVILQDAFIYMSQDVVNVTELVKAKLK